MIKEISKTNKVCWIWNFCGLLNVYWRTIKVETETEHYFIDDNSTRKDKWAKLVYWQCRLYFF